LGEISTTFEVKWTKSARSVEMGYPEPGETASRLVSALVILLIKSSLMVHFEVYYAGGATVLHGSPLYGLNLTIYGMNLPFTYTPFAALIFVPFALLPLPIAEIVWTVINVCALGVISWWALDMMRVSSWRFRLALSIGIAVFATLLDPILCNLVFGQINVLLMLLVMLDFQRWMPPKWRGIALGVAAGIKLIPLIFVVYLFLIGRRRAAVLAGITFICTILIGLLVIPTAFHQYWLGGTAFDLKRILTPTDVDHSLFGLFARLAGDATSPPAWAKFVCAIVGILGLIAATVANRRGHELLGVVLVGNTSLLVSPVTWMATMVWIVPTLIWLALPESPQVEDSSSTTVV
jgi:alpha-1,2-mannosyltransferase